MTRKERLLSGITKDMIGLEIGPSINPIVPKREGYRVETIDHTDKQGLVEKYLTDEKSRDKIDEIEEVDYVWSGGSYSELTGKMDYYDYIIACHVIEHTVDLIGFLLDCQTMLKEGGRLILAVPDKRYCFDLYKPVTTAGQLIDVHERGGLFHSYGSVVDHFFAAADGGIRLSPTEFKETDCWGNYNVRADEMLCLKHDIASLQPVLAAAREQKEYIDIHRFIFTPASFALIIHELSVLGIISLDAEQIDGNIGYEFIVRLKKNAKSADAARMSADEELSKRFALLKKIQAEEHFSGAPFAEYRQKKQFADDLNMHYAIDEYALNGKQLFVRGWAYRQGFDCDSQNVYLSLTEKKNGKRRLFPLVKTLRPDVTDATGDSCYELSGFIGFIELSDALMQKCYLKQDELDLFVENEEPLLVGNLVMSKYDRLCEPQAKKLARRILKKA